MCSANDINSCIEITACTKPKANYKSFTITSRDQWNENKAKIYGSHFFYPIIFVYIKQVFSDDDSASTNSTYSTPSNQRQSDYIKDKDQSLKVNNSFMEPLEILKHRSNQTLVNTSRNHISHFKLSSLSNQLLSLHF